jgi:hypothetical protein
MNRRPKSNYVIPKCQRKKSDLDVSIRDII